MGRYMRVHVDYTTSSEDLQVQTFKCYSRPLYQPADSSKFKFARHFPSVVDRLTTSFWSSKTKEKLYSRNNILCTEVATI